MPHRAIDGGRSTGKDARTSVPTMPDVSRKTTQSLVDPFRVTTGRRFTLKDHRPGNTLDFKSKAQTAALLKQGVSTLSELQEKLYAQDRWAVLLIFQAMDAAGKDSTIKHVMSGINPTGCQVYSFKAPSPEELDHDFLWRTTRCLPERGRIGIFNRSYYEETLIVRVHPELLARQHLPESLVTRRIWRERFDDINAFERYLSRNGVLVLKFFLHVGKEEQRKRFLERLEEPEKNWKFSIADVHERDHWDAYQDAYEDMIRHTAHEHAPWFVVPSNAKWFARLVVATAVIDGLEKLKLAFPEVDQEKRRELATVKRALLRQGGQGRRARKA
jgi:PPK2 family polyphosphate:nucleotide phosphotransferase